MNDAIECFHAADFVKLVSMIDETLDLVIKGSESTQVGQEFGKLSKHKIV